MGFAGASSAMARVGCALTAIVWVVLPVLLVLLVLLWGVLSRG